VSNPAGPPELLGKPAPDLTLPSSTGTPFHLAEARRGGPVVLFFFIHGSTPG
jgi:peroxiredoxin